MAVKENSRGASIADRKTQTFLAGGGEMGARIRAFDWTSTPLGPIEFWSQSLKTSVGLILTSRHPMWIGWGPKMTFLYNDAYLHVLGAAKHPEALGKPAAEVWAEIWDICGPLADKVFQSGEASFVDDVRLFMDRGDFLEETFYSFSYSPIRDESGEISGLFCPSTDVTPKVLNARRLRTLSELASSEPSEKTTAGACAIAAQTLRKNPDDIPFGLLYLADAEGKWAFLEQVIGAVDDELANRREVDLRDASESAPWPVAEVFRTRQRQIVPVKHIPGLPRGVASRRVAEAVVLPVTSRGEHKPYGVLVAGVNPCRPLDEEHLTFFELIAGQVATAIQNARELEDEKKRADMLAEVDRAKTVFFSNVSHEFRTPLTLMLGPLESLLAKPESLPAKDCEHLVIAHRNSLRLLKLVNSLLDFSRIEAGRVKASYTPTDLSGFTADLASNFRSSMEAVGLQLVVDCAPHPERVYVDVEMWEKIVLNLLSNAFKFTFEGSVTVCLRHSGTHAVLTVSDTGVGVPEAELPRIFERFHRIESVRGRTYEGTGIGLALVQELVKLHGGSISATSRFGEGSTFTVSVPLGTAHLPIEAVESGPAPQVAPALAQAFTSEVQTWLSHTGPRGNAAGLTRGSEPGSKLRIVLADDNSDMREHITRILGHEYDIWSAEDGEQALELVRQHAPDLLLTDVMMPKFDGFELLRALRAAPRTRTLPVIFISARAGEEMRVEGLQAGADDYLVKPFTANELRARVGTHIQMAIARRRATEQEATLRAEAEAARDEVIHILENMTNGFIGLDRNWHLTNINAEAERLNGIRREDMLGRSLWELFPEPGGTPIHREFLRVAKERIAVEFDNYYEPWKRWLHIKAYPASHDGLSVFFEDITTRKAAERERAALLLSEREARVEAETLNELARRFSAELDLQKLIKAATDAATKLTGAKFGAFFYNVRDEKGESYVLHTLCGAPLEAFANFELPRNTPLFEPTFRGIRVVRSHDILTDPNYGKNPPYQGMPPGHLPVRSYLAVPVVGPSGDVLGGLFFAHPEPGVFTERAERIAVGIASHAAIAVDNARLFAKAEQEITQRKQAEALLRESEWRFRQMIDALPAAIYTTDAEGHLTHFNPAAARLSGREPELGSDQWCVNWKLFLPEGTPLSNDQSTTATALKHGRIAQGTECIAERPDGTRFWCIPYVTPLFDGQGRIAGGINMFVDITDRKAADEALRGSEERFRAIVEATPDCVKVVAADGTLLLMNSSGLAMVGAQCADAVIGKSFYDLIPPEFRELFREFNKRICQGEKGSLEFDITGLQGQRRHMETHAVPLRNPDGSIAQLAITRDISERKRAEEASLLLGAIVDSSDDAIISKDLSGVITSWNKGAERLFGYTADEVIGRSITILIPPDRLSEEPDILSRLRRGERVDHFETIRRRKDGSLLNISLTISPVKGGHGNIIGASKIARDITERKRAEAALLASESRFRQLADSMPQIVWTARPDGFLDYYNERWYEFTGFNRDEFGDVSWEPILHPEDMKRWYETWYDSVKTGQPYRIEYRFWDRHENRWRWFMGRALPIRDDEGNIVKWFGTCTDIDEQKCVEDELRRANQDLEQFAYSASHDLQEPLRGVKIYSELLRRRYRDKLEGQALEFLDYLSASASRMEMLIRDLLAYTQVTKLEAAEEDADANEALTDTLANLNGAVMQSGARVTSDPLPRVRVHDTHLKQLFQNLVGNAIKYRSPERVPAVHVSAKRQDQYWLFSVIDNGIGIEPEYKERIFGLFKRLHTGDEYSGTGIGLAICQRIVDRYHGRIWVESEPGKGSNFLFTLPV
ncbi:MAG: PAS domain S-box protein [Acidobacteriaceae bacterium]|nr:PAS domain S-box protein [Acidobacteriaceae bacterium]